MWLLSRFQVPITVIPTQTQQKHNKSGLNMPTSMKNSLETQKQKPSHQCFTNTLQHAIWLAEFIFNCNISDSTFIRPFKYRYKKHISNCETYLIFSGIKNIMCICQSKQQTNLQTKQSNVMVPWWLWKDNTCAFTCFTPPQLQIPPQHFTNSPSVFFFLISWIVSWVPLEGLLRSI